MLLRLRGRCSGSGQRHASCVGVAAPSLRDVLLLLLGSMPLFGVLRAAGGIRLRGMRRSLVGEDCCRTRTHCTRVGAPSVLHACSALWMGGHTSADGWSDIEQGATEQSSGSTQRGRSRRTRGRRRRVGRFCVRRPSIARCRICGHFAGTEGAPRRRTQRKAKVSDRPSATTTHALIAHLTCTH